MDEGSLDLDNLKNNSKIESDADPNITHSSLGRKQKAKSSAFPRSQTGPDSDYGFTFGSLGRQGLGNKSVTGDSGDSGCSGTSGGSGVERRKRKADEDIEAEDTMDVMEASPHLESVTKHRVKGPSGK